MLSQLERAIDATAALDSRIDREVELGNATVAQLKNLLPRFSPGAADRTQRLAAAYPARARPPVQIEQTPIATDRLYEAAARWRAASGLG